MSKRRRRPQKSAPRKAKLVKSVVKSAPARLSIPPVRAPRKRWLLGIGALAVALSAGVVDAAPARLAKLVSLAHPHQAIPQAVPEEKPEPSKVPWARLLPTVSVLNQNTNARADFRLYTEQGTLDMNAVYEFMRIACTVPDAPDRADGRVAEPLEPRLVQLVFRAAYHFGGATITVVSATRKDAEGKHRHGEAIDFKLEGVKAADLAKYVQTFSRAGVGIYTHPQTQYVHVDVRERSYHWADASPPGVTWREHLLPDPDQESRDGDYESASDLPETAY